jgi:hypothetical protein
MAAALRARGLGGFPLLSDYEPTAGLGAYFNVEQGFELVCRSRMGISST